MKDAVRLDLVPHNVAEIAERPRKEVFLPDYYSVEEVGQLLDKLQGHWMYLPVLLSVFYGLRRSEVLGLRWGDIDFANKTIIIRHTRVYGNAEGKNTALERDILKRKSSYRTLPMPEPIQVRLEYEKRSRYEDGEVSEIEYVCVNGYGNPIAPNYFSQCFKKFLREKI